ncbi:sporulation-delaying-protein transporter subunit SkiZ [Bacillus halotolerans]|uniref:Sporulation-delaying-protein transporter subunit SkiZ n=1 Tax=Bacillus halotolerans TaxID=260554 RepID=A0ABY7I5W5_9BACI|nr:MULTISPECIES: sporulation-delaying-protein transporter subunit SkiZ [Bacillus]KUP33164.1 macrolide ABC transporter permease [Bacillus halotolerans]KUP33605.1 macrolide ABC transporter permease [Bacillus halotolerans]MBL4968329.1 sporulation-delaying-protein transporter subunit SkiZ [Bacillus halotolerans]MBL4972390.1 sporulation-delaying-protein transporter subunit SkiZ [Bacillus halotolerans]MBT9250690.1 sporulation-delaying-protein transporter subunit SkiZ [Bacillus halotolerans]
MSLLENIRMALSSVLAHKMRSILTMLGIIIGVGSVIVVVAVGQGGEQMLKQSISGPGNTVELYYMPSDEELASNPNAVTESTFTENDISGLKEIDGIRQVVASTSESMKARYHEEETDVTINGINDGYMNVNSLEIESGRTFTDNDFLAGKRAGIISQKMAEELFDKSSPLGEVVWVNGQPVEIIGVLKKETGLLSFGLSEMYVPFNMMKSSFGTSDFSNVSLQVESADDIKSIGKEAAQLVNDHHGTEDSYQVMNMEEIAAGIGKITTIMTTIIGSIAGISLLVGGIGVMNIMLVSVTERTREIGIRKSLGATRGQILTQFLIESVVLTLIGGLIGIGIGYGGAALVSAIAGWPSLVSWQVVCGGVLFSMLIGVVFGMLPANKAAKLDPIEALRYE